MSTPPKLLFKPNMIFMDELKPGKLWRIEPTPPPAPVSLMPEEERERIHMKAQVCAFREAMRFARNSGYSTNYAEDDAFERFKKREKEIIDTLTAQWIVEHGQDV